MRRSRLPRYTMPVRLSRISVTEISFSVPSDSFTVPV